MYQSFQLRARATRNVVVDRKSTRLNSSHDSISLVAVSLDRKSTRLNSSHGSISYAVFCLKKKNIRELILRRGVRSRGRTGATHCRSHPFTAPLEVFCPRHSVSVFAGSPFFFFF